MSAESFAKILKRVLARVEASGKRPLTEEERKAAALKAAMVAMEKGAAQILPQLDAAIKDIDSESAKNVGKEAIEQVMHTEYERVRRAQRPREGTCRGESSFGSDARKNCGVGL